MKFHPFAEIFPLLDSAALDDLIEDIKTHGLREPIITYRGAILDGRNRFLACQKANVKPAFTVYTGSEESALAWVVSANIHRRHLTVEQRAMAAARIATLQKGANQHSSKKIGQNDEDTARAVSSQAAVAERLSVSVDSIQRAKKVVEKGSKPLQRAVEAGEVPLRRAAAVADLPKSEQLAAAKAKQEKPPEPPEPAELPDDDDGAVPDPSEEERLTAMEREYSASIEKVMGADDKLTAAHAEIKRQAAEIAALKLSRNGFQNRCAELTRRVKALLRENERLKKKST